MYRKKNEIDKEIIIHTLEALMKIILLMNNVKKFLNNIKNNINKNIGKIRKNEFSNDDNIIEFIMTAANLRAENYLIEKNDKLKTISVIGSIISVVWTTTTL